MSEKVHVCEGCRLEQTSRGLPPDWVATGTSVYAIVMLRRHRCAEWCPECQHNGIMDREAKTPAQAQRAASAIVQSEVSSR
jgi:hypothetical protein